MTRLLCLLGIIALCGVAVAEEKSWTKSLEDRAKRGTLEDARQIVRGDTGKWSDEGRLQHAPPLARKPPKLLLDEWGDMLVDEELQLKSGDDNWLLFRTAQLNDNDRLWIERVERRGNELTVIASQAVWTGRYQKNFTQHIVLGVNLGPLEPGKYEAKWIVQPLEFTKFDRPARMGEANWPDDDRPATQKPIELLVKFTVAPASP